MALNHACLPVPARARNEDYNPRNQGVQVVKDLLFEIVAVAVVAIGGTVFARQLAIFKAWQTSDSLLLRGVSFLLSAGALLLVALVVIWFFILPSSN